MVHSRGGFCDLPVCGVAGAAKLAFGIGVQQECGSIFVTRKVRLRTSPPYAKGFDYRDFLGDFRDDFRGFVTVELDGGESQRFCEGEDGLGSPVHENANGGHQRWKLADNFFGGKWRNSARAFWVKVKTDGVSAEFAG